MSFSSTDNPHYLHISNISELPARLCLQVQSDQFIPVEDIHVEMSGLERQLDELEQRGVELEQKLRDCSNGQENLKRQI